MKRSATIFSLIMASMQAVSADIDSIPIESRSAREYIGFAAIGTAPYLNPALQTIRQNFSLSMLTIGYSSRTESKPVISTLGRGERKGFFDARTYLHFGKSTVWGSAGYDNGKVLDMQLCESPDVGKVYPYTIADTVGGNQKMERYRFSGGYARHTDRICWGVSIGYVAGLYYRQTDPRPKTITGQLDISIGVAFRAGNYLIGPDVAFERYRQSTDISFVSEMGESKLYHTTGLGTHYIRFEGNGSNVFSDCYTYSAGVSMHPDSRTGVFAGGRLSMMTMRHVISDLNKLPMANVNERVAFLQAGYMAESNVWSWKAYVEGRMSRRHGKENLFGDPTSGSYPQIGSRLAYADNSWALYAGGIWEYRGNRWTLSAEPSLGWSHRLAVYAVPHRKWKADHVELSLKMSVIWNPFRRWTIGGKIFGSVRNSPELELTGIPTDSQDHSSRKFNDAVRNDFRNVTSSFRTAGVSMTVRFALSSRYILAVSPSFIHGSLASGIVTNEGNLMVQFIF